MDSSSSSSLYVSKCWRVPGFSVRPMTPLYPSSSFWLSHPVCFPGLGLCYSFLLEHSPPQSTPPPHALGLKHHFFRETSLTLTPSVAHRMTGNRRRNRQKNKRKRERGREGRRKGRNKRVTWELTAFCLC